MFLNILFVLIITQTILGLSSIAQIHLHGSETDDDIANMIYSKGYIPSNTNLLSSNVIQSKDNDDTYILSKLSDDVLIKLLSHQSKKKDFSIRDIMKIAFEETNENNVLLSYNEGNNSTSNNKSNIKNTINNKIPAYFRLENLEIKPQLQNDIAELIALKKLNSLLINSRQEKIKKDELISNDDKKEILFDILVKQLKALFCKTFPKSKELFLEKSFKQIAPKNTPEKSHFIKSDSLSKLNNKGEFMFLIINDEIKSKSTDDLILVDPETMERNSSILLLGPITTPLSNEQLTTIMNRISNELSKPEYLTLLQQLSDGTFNKKNKRLVNQLVYGPETRRYIKPHRCNHQSRLAKVYGGPKWLICTGYLNINTPSLYN